MLGLRLVLLLLAGFSLFSDEQERFICNTIQPGCSNVCFDAFAPVSVFRLWLLHLVLLALPHLLFATYVAHEVLTHRGSGGFCSERSPAGSPPGLDTEPSLHGSPRPEPRGARFSCAYVLVVASRILLEAAFGAGQFYLFGLSVPKSFLCYEAPCTSGVECYVSRRTEKSLMLSFMLGVSSLSVLLSLFDLASSVKATARRRERLAEELIKGEQSSVLTATTGVGDGDNSPENGPDGKDPQVDAPPTPTGTPAPPHYVLHRPPQGRGNTGQRGQSGQQSDSSDSPDRRAWV